MTNLVYLTVSLYTFNPREIQLDIANTQPTHFYSLQHSTDLINWSGTPPAHFIQTTFVLPMNTPYEFFRVEDFGTNNPSL